MTPSFVRRLAVPVLSAVFTAVALIGVLAVQRARDRWPFAPAGLPPAASATPPASETHLDHSGVPERIAITVEPTKLQALGIRIEDVRRESLIQAVQAVATVVPDESRISHVHTRVAGWVEQLDVNTTGELVRAGQPLARIFSQELLSSQTEYLAVRKAAAASGIASAAIAGGRTRLTVLGMTAAEIDAIEQSGEPRRLVTIVAPRSGVVVNRGITAGTAVDPSTTLLTIADLSRVWVLAEVPEAAIPAIRTGSTAQLDFPGSGRPPFAARVEYVYPTLTERTRTLRVRFSVANGGGTLRPGLYGTAALEVSGAPAITVSRDAVVDTGRQQHVFVVAGEQFEPRLVTLGIQTADRVEVRSGLTEGERVVAAGVFLLDSESRLRATGGAGGHNHGAPPAPDLPKPAQKPPVDPHAGHRE